LALNTKRKESYLKFNVTFDSARCKGCELCAAWCGKGLIAFDASRLNKIGIHPAMITDKEACIGCCNCALMCPDGVIGIEKPEN
jgi:2-oxoglutarate ferredoxin oxidoreductase subunit delta